VKKLKNFLYTTILLLIAVACNKEDQSLIGKDILPDGDNFNVEYYIFDSINAVTIPGKKSISNNRSIALLGSYNLDPNFGMVKADFATHLRLSSTTTIFGDSIQIDSVKFFVLFNGDNAEDRYYGDKTTELHFKVYELDSTIYYDSTYYSNFQLNTASNNLPICDTTFVPNYENTSFELKLDTSFGRKVINAYNSHTTITNEDFIKDIKGIYVTTDSVSSGGSIMYINHLSNNTFIRIYYKSKVNNTLSNREFDLYINSYSAEINMFKNTVGNIQYNTSADYIYTQGMGGPIGNLDLSFVETYSDSGKIVINKAELILPNENDAIYGSPEKMYIEIVDTTGATNLVKSGYLNDDKTEYSFIITDHITSIINKKETKTGIYIYPANPTINAGKTKLINNLNNKNIKLKLTYTKY
jgi:hypothetical protein